MNEEQKSLQEIRQLPWFRKVRLLQWLGLVMLALAIYLGAFTRLNDDAPGIFTIAILAAIGFLILLPARFLLTVTLMNSSSDEKNHKQ